ncbi:MAG: hypothetical protein GWP91_00960 [Rhodobacterales bacterium]|nr:hypothetical protein [Rhodobacterales bacterium]
MFFLWTAKLHVILDCRAEENTIVTVIAILVGLGGCANSPVSDAAGPAVDPVVESLDPVDRLIRASIVLRGVRPSVADMDAVVADPTAYEDIIETYLASPEFSTTIGDVYAEVLMMRTDVQAQMPLMGTMADTQYVESIYKATSESPLKLVQQIVDEDLPLTTLVTADWMWTNKTLSTVYGLPFDEDGPEWQKSWWADGRPAGGLLSDSEIWRRHVSAGSNFNRLRANFLADVFLCDNYSGRDIALINGVNIADEFAVANAALVVPECVSCHQTMDPLASHLWGFKLMLKGNHIVDAFRNGCIDWQDPQHPSPLPEINYTWGQYCYPLENYLPAHEDDWEAWNIRPPSYYGSPSHDLQTLGANIAEDPRFAMCAARSFTGYFTQTDKMAVAYELASEHRDVFIESGYSAKALARSIVLSSEFAIKFAPDEETVGVQVIRPEQYDRLVYDLTGFRWMAVADEPDCAVNYNDFKGSQCWGPVNLAQSDVFGFRSMAGGIDGYLVTSPVHSPTPTKEIVMGRFAAEDAAFVVDSDLSLVVSERRLLTKLDGSDWSEAMVRDQLVSLHWQMLGLAVVADDESINEYWALYQDRLSRDSDTAGAWKLIIHALLRDPRVLFY